MKLRLMILFMVLLSGMLLAAEVSTTGTGQPRLSARVVQEIRFGGHRASIELVAVSPNQRYFASADQKTVIIWDATSNREFRRWTPDGTIQAVRFDQTSTALWVITGKTLKRLVLQTGKIATPLEFKVLVTDSSRFGSFSPDGTMASWVESPQTAQIVDTTAGQVLQRFQLPDDEHFVEEYSDKKPISRFTPDGRLWASVVNKEGTAGETTIWQIKTGKRIVQLQETYGWIQAIEFSPDLKQMVNVMDNDRISFWDLKTGRKIRIVRDLIGFLQGNVDQLTWRNNTLEVGAFATINTKTWKIHRYKRSGFRTVRLNAREYLVLNDNKIVRLQLQSAKQKPLQGQVLLDYAVNQVLTRAVVTLNTQTLELYNIVNNQFLQRWKLESQEDRPCDIQFFHQTNRFALIAWSSNRNKFMINIFEKGKKPRKIQTELDGYSMLREYFYAPPCNLIWYSNKQILLPIYFWRMDETQRQYTAFTDLLGWNTTTTQPYETKILKGQVQVSPHLQYALQLDQFRSSEINQQLELRNFKTGRLLWKGKAPLRYANAVFSDDSQYIILYRHETIVVIHAPSGKLKNIWQLPSWNQAIKAVSISPNHKWLLLETVVGYPGFTTSTTRLYDFRTQQEYLLPSGLRSLEKPQFVSQGRYLSGINPQENALQVWQLNR